MKFPRSAKRGLVISLLVAGTVPTIGMSAFANGSSAPGSPGPVFATSGNKSLVVSWQNGGGGGDTTPNSSISNDGNPTFTVTAAASGKTSRNCISTTSSCTVHSLANGVIYTVTVVATTKSGSSPPSTPLTSIVGVPGPPTQVRVNAGTASVTVVWGPTRSSGVAEVTAYMATASPGGFSCSTTGTLFSPPARTCQISGLNAGENYWVTVTATNAYGTGTPSQPNSVRVN